ncbi:DMT family transporter [Polynucleobacter sp. Latsch14-2]|jgi:drug/metabolite transporter (DMT)-like permease|uniref:DMT family transporter n=1 Tax=Polynucleobacter sp. Latsch14-2 TaxID=2576920 RepID=UPI001C0BF5F1|nr:DMT family transporter [Polynucleobacter sp. Latsch14-2]MBU3615158.1 DMT family transporter [Polynucleobacter sp. Latsch14-2]
MSTTPQSIQHKRYMYGILMAAIGSILFSGKAILVKLAFTYGANAETLLALRMLIALPLFWSIYWWQSRKQTMSPMSWPDCIKIFCLGFLGYFFSSYLDFLGLQYISAGLERIVLYLTPTIVLLISYFVLHKAISRLQWAALVVGYLGVITVFIQDAHSSGSAAWLGMLLVFVSACVYAVYMIGSGEMVSRIGSIRLVVYASSSSAFFSIAQALIYNPGDLLAQTSQIYWLSLINASFCTVAPMLLIMIAINRIGSPLVAQAGILGPVSTIFMGWAVLSEPITWLQIGGMALVVSAMWLLVRNDSQKQKPLDCANSNGLDGKDLYGS